MARGQRGWRVIPKSGHEDEIRDMLCSGWSTRRVREFLRERYRFEVAESVLRYYRDAKIDPALILPASVLKSAYEKVTVKVDVLNDLAVAIRTQEDRLATELAIERNIKKLLPTTVKELELYWKQLTDYAELMQSLGQLPKVAQKLEFPSGVPLKVGPGPTLGELMKELQQEQADTAPDEPE